MRLNVHPMSDPKDELALCHTILQLLKADKLEGADFDALIQETSIMQTVASIFHRDDCDMA